MIEKKYYTDAFFSGHTGGALLSAKHILPHINSIIKPNSVVDVGCGAGNWLRVWKESLNISDYLGIEGPYISKEVLQISPDKILLHDLKLPIQLKRRFDLAMSLEVAEHLPEEVADQFVESLTGLSDVVLFSASVPGQEGTYHINEQRPEYWAKLFLKRNYVVVDCIREKVWNNDEVEWWYKQNILLYVKKEKLAQYPELIEKQKNTDPDHLLRIHPWLYFYHYERNVKTRTVLGYLRWKMYLLKLRLTKKLNN
jgi:SAM-dependent methyltransferase